MSKEALLTGTAGGIVGAVTAVIGVLWSFIVYTFLMEINIYSFLLTQYLEGIILGLTPGYGYSVPFLLLYYPESASLLGVYSLVLSVLLVATGVLVSVGFYGTYRIGGGPTGLSVLIFGIIGTASSALLIIMGNLITGYNFRTMLVFPGELFVDFTVPTTPNFLLICIGLVVLGFTFIILGSVSRSVREMTAMPLVSRVAGTLSILGAAFFILDGLIGFFATNISLTFVGFGLIFITFILWAVVFYSSRDMQEVK